MHIPVTPKTVARLGLLSVGGLIAAGLVPPRAEGGSVAATVTLALLVGTTFALLLSESVARRERLFEAVRTELNRLRRLYHLSKNLSSSSQRHRGWFTDLHGHLYAYLTFFSGKDFDRYDDANVAYRRLSYHVYTVPDLESRKEEALFAEILRTTSVIAEARQQIKELWRSRLNFLSWVVVLLMGSGLVAALLLGVTDSSESRIISGIAVVVVLFAADLLWETDTLHGERKALAERYADNVRKLELGRGEEERV